ncbi:hypothetical protein PR048_033190 [Dryococelus australis]|uniref:Essential MCU regulator, mitochondrial n=1 Tax=Dryococelus australis TaxID=614101 RepID=A0ABQ9FZK1_9NEOP|nr:hypothetical protein PR048_033190 [Dryococelus australis]
MLWLYGVLGGAGTSRALCAARQPGVCPIRLRRRRGGGLIRVPLAQQPYIKPEPRHVTFGLVKVVCVTALGLYLGDEIGDYIKNILKTEFDFPEPNEYEADDDLTMPLSFSAVDPQAGQLSVDRYKMAGDAHPPAATAVVTGPYHVGGGRNKRKNHRRGEKEVILKSLPKHPLTNTDLQAATNWMIFLHIKGRLCSQSALLFCFMATPIL